MIKPIAVEAKLDKPRSLIFTRRSRLIVEREVNRYRGVGPTQWSSWSVLLQQLSIDTVYAILWAAMLHEDARLKFETAIDFLSEIDDDELLVLVGEIFA